MTSPHLRAAICIVSDTASRDPSTDKCAPILRGVFDAQSNSTWDVSSSTIIPDDVLQIQRTVTTLSDGPDAVNLIVTSGGTGFAVKDKTPEAVQPLIHRHAPGLVHGMLAASLQVTPFAMMARPIAGVRNSTIIITLPGSPKGAKENLEAIIKLLPHACQQAAGGDSRTMHIGGTQKLEKDAGWPATAANTGPQAPVISHSHGHHHHHHHHGHGGHAGPKPRTDPSTHPISNDPSIGPSERNRRSPYPMLSVEEALAVIQEHVPKPETTKIHLNRAVNHVLAADVSAVEAVPAFRASIVDGYAVICSGSTKTSSKGVFPVAFAAHAHAGDAQEPPTLHEGQIARITTGAPLPVGADAVVMVEDTVVRKKSADGREEEEIEILTDKVERGENIREIGSDVKKGEVVMRKGDMITAAGGEFGLLASVGVQVVEAYEMPKIGVLSTGDEIVSFGTERELRLGEVRDTNRPTLLTVARGMGYQAVDLDIAEDDPAELEADLRHGLAKSDVLITSGGVSMGEFDLLKPMLERQIGGKIHFGRVAMKPGKPTTFATVPAEQLKDPQSGDRGAFKDKVVFCLPGNPASAMVTFMLFVLPSLHAMSGVEPRGLPRVMVKLDAPVKCDASREEYHRVVVGAKPGDSSLWATSTGGQRSSRIGSFMGANALLKLPAGAGTLEKGQLVEALMMAPPHGFQAMA